MYSSSKPLNINKPSKIKYSFNDNPNNQTFMFELLIKFKNNAMHSNAMHIIRKIEKTKYCDILLENNNINYLDIEYFELKALDLDNNKEYILVDNFNDKSNSFSKNDNNLYIEFSHNSLGLARATCYIMGIDINSYIISPPN
jgi:hypothetical protein